jgi:hypothetical protein
MDKMPPEICTKIFSYACLDTGYTGRSLSLVSKYIHDTSQSVKLQSIALHGQSQTLAFAEMLKQMLPYPHLRRIRYLFIAIDAPYSYPNPDETPDSVGRRAHAAINASRKMGVAIVEILRGVGESLELLEMVLASQVASYLDIPQSPIPLPRLKELTTHGIFPFGQPGETIGLNLEPCQLRRLHIARSVHVHSDDLYGCIAKSAPSLTHLRFSDLHARYYFAGDLEAALGSREPVLDQSRNPSRIGRLPTSIERVLVQPLPPPSQGRCGPLPIKYMSFLRELRLLNRKNERLVLLKAQEGRLQSQVSEADANDWLDRVDGGEGCWSMNDMASKED